MPGANYRTVRVWGGQGRELLPACCLYLAAGGRCHTCLLPACLIWTIDVDYHPTAWYHVCNGYILYSVCYYHHVAVLTRLHRWTGGARRTGPAEDQDIAVRCNNACSIHLCTLCTAFLAPSYMPFLAITFCYPTAPFAHGLPNTPTTCLPTAIIPPPAHPRFHTVPHPFCPLPGWPLAMPPLVPPGLDTYCTPPHAARVDVALAPVTCLALCLHLRAVWPLWMPVGLPHAVHITTTHLRRRWITPAWTHQKRPPTLPRCTVAFVHLPLHLPHGSPHYHTIDYVPAIRLYRDCWAVAGRLKAFELPTITHTPPIPTAFYIAFWQDMVGGLVGDVENSHAATPPGSVPF